MNRRVAERERMLDELRLSIHRRTRVDDGDAEAGERVVPVRRHEPLWRVQAASDFVAPGRHPAVVTNADGRSDRAVDDRHSSRDVLEHVALLLAVEKSRKRNRSARRHGVRGQIPGLEQFGADQPGKVVGRVEHLDRRPACSSSGHPRIGKQRRQLSKQPAQAHIRFWCRVGGRHPEHGNVGAGRDNAAPVG